jgi:hypothetical protein
MADHIVCTISITAKGPMSKGPHIFIRKADQHFRVICQRQYPHAVEEVLISQRFKTLEDAQEFVDVGLRAQKIYRSLRGQPDWEM